MILILKKEVLVRWHVSFSYCMFDVTPGPDSAINKGR